MKFLSVSKTQSWFHFWHQFEYHVFSVKSGFWACDIIRTKSMIFQPSLNDYELSFQIVYINLFGETEATHHLFLGGNNQ